jgi:membrane protein YqaA with SNARE-associated domain
MLETCIQFTIYAIRWQLSGFILAPVIAYGAKHGWSPAMCAVVGNFLGAVVFYPVDKYITFGIARWLRVLKVAVKREGL